MELPKLINVPALYAALNWHRIELHLLWRDVARESGLSSSTFSRMRLNLGPDLQGYAACCNWLGVSLDTFLTAPTRPSTRSANQPSLGLDLLRVFNQHRVPYVYLEPLIALVTTLTPQEDTP